MESLTIVRYPDICSRCGKITKTVWHICEVCRDEAQAKYKGSLKL